MKDYEYGIIHLLNALKERSQCLDKQVACVITDTRGNILSVGVNRIIKCDKNCHDKINRTCEVEHAEVVAAQYLHRITSTPRIAYVNLFPCVPCQQTLENWVDEIVVFGPQHKDQVFKNIRLEPNIYAEILADNGVDKQLSVAQGELAELITEISDYFYRPKKKPTTEHLVDEIVDAELMIDQIKLVAWTKDPELYNLLRTMRISKIKSLIQRIRDGQL